MKTTKIFFLMLLLGSAFLFPVTLYSKTAGSGSFAWGSVEDSAADTGTYVFRNDLSSITVPGKEIILWAKLPEIKRNSSGQWLSAEGGFSRLQIYAGNLLLEDKAFSDSIIKHYYLTKINTVSSDRLFVRFYYANSAEIPRIAFSGKLLRVIAAISELHIAVLICLSALILLVVKPLSNTTRGQRLFFAGFALLSWFYFIPDVASASGYLSVNVIPSVRFIIPYVMFSGVFIFISAGKGAAKPFLTVLMCLAFLALATINYLRIYGSVDISYLNPMVTIPVVPLLVYLWWRGDGYIKTVSLTIFSELIVYFLINSVFHYPVSLPLYLAFFSVINLILIRFLFRYQFDKRFISLQQKIHSQEIALKEFELEREGKVERIARLEEFRAAVSESALRVSRKDTAASIIGAGWRATVFSTADELPQIVFSSSSSERGVSVMVLESRGKRTAGGVPYQYLKGYCDAVIVNNNTSAVNLQSVLACAAKNSFTSPSVFCARVHDEFFEFASDSFPDPVFVGPVSGRRGVIDLDFDDDDSAGSHVLRVHSGECVAVGSNEAVRVSGGSGSFVGVMEKIIKQGKGNAEEYLNLLKKEFADKDGLELLIVIMQRIS